MITTLEDIREGLEVDLCLARLQHIAARRRLRLADTSANRAAEAQCRARLDVILDLLAELGGSWPVDPAGRHSRRRPSTSSRACLPADDVVLRAAAALPHDDRRRAVAGLRHQLQVMADAAGATPDWTTLTVTGPTEMAGVGDETRFEWRAGVAVHVTTRTVLPDREPGTSRPIPPPPPG